MTNQIPSLEYTTISTDSYRFLKHLLFGSWESVYVAASERAYRDMCRTLRLEGVDGSKLRTTVDKLLETEIQSLLRKPPTTQRKYDETPPHARDFSRELGGFRVANIKHLRYNINRNQTPKSSRKEAAAYENLHFLRCSHHLQRL